MAERIYCTTYALLDRRGQVRDIEHEFCHAEDARRAELGFRNAHTRELAAKRIKVVEVGVALGSWIDEKGEVHL